MSHQHPAAIPPPVPARETFAPNLFAGVSVALSGGGSGIGRRTAIRFAELGASVSVCGRRGHLLDETVAMMQAAAAARGVVDAGYLACVADVKQPETLAAWRDQTVEVFGVVDQLICNAGANFLAPAAAISPNGFATVIGTVLLGTWNTIQAFYPALADRDQHTRGLAQIVLMASTTGYTASAFMAHSGAGKAGMLNLAQTLAVEWSSAGIRVNAVAPGPVDTDGANSRLWADDDARRKVADTVPLGRMGSPDDCADAVLFLASPAASFITGTTLTVDGGNFLKPLPQLL